MNITAPCTWCSLLACFTLSIFTISLQDRLTPCFQIPQNLCCSQLTADSYVRTHVWDDVHCVLWSLCHQPAALQRPQAAVSSAHESAPLCFVPHATAGVIWFTSRTCVQISFPCVGHWARAEGWWNWNNKLSAFKTLREWKGHTV